jgi:acetyl-CoA C-acetyltransferase
VCFSYSGKEFDMSSCEIVICNPVRTAIGTYGGTLKNVAAAELGAAAIRECLKRSGLAPETIETVVMGHVVRK